MPTTTSDASRPLGYTAAKRYLILHMEKWTKSYNVFTVQVNWLEHCSQASAVCAVPKY
jgi:hypothetical protein